MARGGNLKVGDFEEEMKKVFFFLPGNTQRH